MLTLTNRPRSSSVGSPSRAGSGFVGPSPSTPPRGGAIPTAAASLPPAAAAVPNPLMQQAPRTPPPSGRRGVDVVDPLLPAADPSQNLSDMAAALVFSRTPVDPNRSTTTETPKKQSSLENEDLTQPLLPKEENKKTGRCCVVQ